MKKRPLFPNPSREKAIDFRMEEEVGKMQRKWVFADPPFDIPDKERKKE